MKMSAQGVDARRHTLGVGQLKLIARGQETALESAMERVCRVLEALPGPGAVSSRSPPAKRSRLLPTHGKPPQEDGGGNDTPMLLRHNSRHRRRRALRW
jgi:hypothetical protein